jgi:hypothetical protein
MVTFSLSQRPWMLVLVLLGAGLGACGGREAAESGEPAPAATEAPLTNPCRSDLVALGYESSPPVTACPSRAGAPIE